MAGDFRRRGLRDQGVEKSEGEESGKLLFNRDCFSLRFRLPCKNAVNVLSTMHHIPLHSTDDDSLGTSVY
jgi:hypothetical protein